MRLFIFKYKAKDGSVKTNLVAGRTMN
jgi:hypothetical protein